MQRRTTDVSGTSLPVADKKRSAFMEGRREHDLTEGLLAWRAPPPRESNVKIYLSHLDGGEP
jgi:hypothetical protein